MSVARHPVISQSRMNQLHIIFYGRYKKKTLLQGYPTIPGADHFWGALNPWCEFHNTDNRGLLRHCCSRYYGFHLWGKSMCQILRFWFGKKSRNSILDEWPTQQNYGVFLTSFYIKNKNFLILRTLSFCDLYALVDLKNNDEIQVKTFIELH